MRRRWRHNFLTSVVGSTKASLLMVSLGVRAIFIVTGPLLGFALDRYGMTSTLLALVVVFTPLMGLVLVPLLLRIRREAAESGRATATA